MNCNKFYKLDQKTKGFHISLPLHLAQWIWMVFHVPNAPSTKLTLLAISHCLKLRTRWYPWEIQLLVSTHQLPPHKSFLGGLGGILDQPKTQSPKSWPNFHFQGGGGCILLTYNPNFLSSPWEVPILVATVLPTIHIRTYTEMPIMPTSCISKNKIDYKSHRTHFACYQSLVIVLGTESETENSAVYLICQSVNSKMQLWIHSDTPKPCVYMHHRIGQQVTW